MQDRINLFCKPPAETASCALFSSCNILSILFFENNGEDPHTKWAACPFLRVPHVHPKSCQPWFLKRSMLILFLGR